MIGEVPRDTLGGVTLRVRVWGRVNDPVDGESRLRTGESVGQRMNRV